MGNMSLGMLLYSNQLKWIHFWMNREESAWEDRENGDLSDNDDSQIAEIKNLSQSNGNSNTTRRYPEWENADHCKGILNIVDWTDIFLRY